MQKNKNFEKEISVKLKLKYLLHTPIDYDEKEEWPLIVFLHGAGERGDDLELVKTHAIPKFLDEREEFPFIVVSPQCPKDTWWNAHFEDLYYLIQEIKENYKVDTKRIYLTGLSMGGFGTWDLASKYPEEFAAIIPVCGGTMNIFEIPKLKNTAVWAFHGDEDRTVPIKRTQEVVDVLKKYNSNVNFTIYKGVGHDSHVRAYKEDIYMWLLKHKK